jgi:protein-S-isoprenylcysteine O-methyltransferase Ste14
MRILPPVALLIGLAAQGLVVAYLWPIAPTVLDLTAGAGFAGCGLLLAVWGANLFRRAETGLVPFTPATKLVITGPFHFTRNPMYLGFVLFSAGVAIATGVYLNLGLALLLWVWLHFTYVQPEEKFMRERFGAEYDAYCRRVPRWL